MEREIVPVIRRQREMQHSYRHTPRQAQLGMPEELANLLRNQREGIQLTGRLHQREFARTFSEILSEMFAFISLSVNYNTINNLIDIFPRADRSKLPRTLSA